MRPSLGHILTFPDPPLPKTNNNHQYNTQVTAKYHCYTFPTIWFLIGRIIWSKKCLTGFYKEISGHLNSRPNSCDQEGTKTTSIRRQTSSCVETKLWGGGDQSVFETITTSLLVTWHSFGRSYWGFLCRLCLAKCLIKAIRSLYYLISKSIEGNLLLFLSFQNPSKWWWLW